MDIGFFTETFLPQTNGVVTSIASFGEELVRRGHNVHIYCPSTSLKSYKGMIVHGRLSLPFPPYPEFKIGLPIGRVEKLDIVHTHGPFLMGGYGLRVAKKQNIPKLSTFHTLLSEYVEYISPLGIGQETLKKISWRYCFHHYNKYDQVITPSCAIRDMLKIKKPIAVIPTGIDVRLLKPESSKKSREKLGIRTEKMYLCLGRLSPEKNLDFVIDTSKYFLGDDSQLIIAGRGPVQRKLENQVADMGMEKKIKFVGYVSDADKVRYYSAADAFILASTSETQGIVVLEAMACGCPVIAADSLAIPEFVKNGKNGFLFRPGDGQQLAELVDNFNYTKRMAKEALKTAHSCSIEKCTDKLEKIYGLLVSDS